MVGFVHGHGCGFRVWVWVWAYGCGFTVEGMRMGASVSAHPYACIRAHTCAYMHTDTCVCTHTHTHVRACPRGEGVVRGGRQATGGAEEKTEETERWGGGSDARARDSGSDPVGQAGPKP